MDEIKLFNSREEILDVLKEKKMKYLKKMLQDVYQNEEMKI